MDLQTQLSRAYLSGNGAEVERLLALITEANIVLPPKSRNALNLRSSAGGSLPPSRLLELPHPGPRVDTVHGYPNIDRGRARK